MKQIIEKIYKIDRNERQRCQKINFNVFQPKLFQKIQFQVKV
jgi:hypothetical protein